ncbi:MAG: hypothetical protein ABA06_01520 [Parcubacteria bacterium C7867-001]|nr:MAG: hypothetical protein ABA06_01520 [Parcubacteria bacterium C7867-001]
MSKTFHLTIARVGENLFDGEAVSVELPGKDGAFTVLADHEAFVTPLKAGEAVVKVAEGKSERISIQEGGIAEVSKNQTTVLL